MSLAKKAGLVPAGKNEDGEQQYIGTKQAWDKYDELLAKDEKEMEQEILDDPMTSQGEIDDINSKYANR